MADDDIIKAGTVILKDLALFDKARIFYEKEVHPVICNAVFDVVKNWAEQNEWVADWGEGEGTELFEMNISPVSWELKKDEWLGWFDLAQRDIKEDRSLKIANFFNVGQTGFGFRFNPQYVSFCGAREWNNFIKTNITNQIDQLTKSGWIYEVKGVFFRPLPLVADGLVSAWENEDWSQVLAPLTETLNSMKADKEVFDSIFDKLKQIYKPEG